MILSDRRIIPYVAEKATNDFYFTISQGHAKGLTGVNIQARNPDINGSEENLCEPNGVLTFLTAASTIRIAAGGNAADTAAGTGARAVYVWGLDADYNEINATIETNGTSASTATTEEFLRVFGARATIVGSGGVNAGNITIEAITGGSTQSYIEAGKGVSKYGTYTIPAGKTGYIIGGRFGVIVAAAGGGPGPGGTSNVGAHIHGWLRKYNELSANNYESWHEVDETLIKSDGGNPSQIQYELTDPIPEKSDIRISAEVDEINTEIVGRMFIILSDN